MSTHNTLDPTRWTIETSEAFETATADAISRNNAELTPDHILAALLARSERGLLAVLGGAGLSAHDAREQVHSRLAELPVGDGTGEPTIGLELRAVMETADRERVALGDDLLSIDHLLAAMVGRLEVDGNVVRNAARRIRASQQGVDQRSDGAARLLERYGRDLVAEARSGRLDPLIGRDTEVRRCMQVLARRSRNNPVLIGEPGVGKTAIVEGLAQRIVEGDAPDSLVGHRLVELDIPAMVAGARSVREFEERLIALLDEIGDDGSEVIVFVEALAGIVGGVDASIDPGAVLKPLLARVRLRLIGTATLEEYQDHVEKDVALERRLQTIDVAPPSVEETVAILQDLGQRHEVHHGLRIRDDALIAAAVLADRHITGRSLPGKAIGLLDEAASMLRIEVDSVPDEIVVRDRRVRHLEIERIASARATADGGTDRLTALDEELAELRAELAAMRDQWRLEKQVIAQIRSLGEQLEYARAEAKRCERDDDLHAAAEIRYTRIPQLGAALDAATDRLAEVQSAGALLKVDVDDQEVAEVVSGWTGVPIDRLLDDEMRKLLRMEATLRERVIGQNHAVDVVSNAIRRRRTGLADPDKPVGSFLFLGPAGVGKSELARSLADFLFDDERSMIRIDMSEYMDECAGSRLVGTPAGQAGPDEGRLTEAIRRRPHAVVVLDEIERAHPDVIEVVLRVLDDGCLRDGRGRTIDCRHTVFVITSRRVGDPEIFFTPELIHRLDEVVHFRALDEADLLAIVDIQLTQLAGRIAARHLELDVSLEAKAWLAKAGLDPDEGARPLGRIIQRTIGDPLARTLISGNHTEGDTVTVDLVGDEIVVA